MTYKFEQFNVEIVNPNVTVTGVFDNIKEKTCNVSLLLETDSAKFGVTLSGFEYSDTWEDDDIYAWVANELVNYEA
jgi:uncharacterized protein YlxP (DUF503 family)